MKNNELFLLVRKKWCLRKTGDLSKNLDFPEIRTLSTGVWKVLEKIVVVCFGTTPYTCVKQYVYTRISTWNKKFPTLGFIIISHLFWTFRIYPSICLLLPENFTVDTARKSKSLDKKSIYTGNWIFFFRDKLRRKILNIGHLLSCW